MGRVAPRRRRGSRRRSADEAARRADAGSRRERRHRRTVLDPPRPELRNRVRSLRQSDGNRHRASPQSRSARCSCSSRGPGRRHPVLPVALGLVLGGSIANLIDRVRLDTSRTSSISSRGRHSTLQTPSSSSASRSSSARSFSPIGRTACTDRAVATLRFSVAEALAGSRLDRALAERDEIGTRSLAERLVRDGAVTVDGTERDKSHRLAAGSVVEVGCRGSGAARCGRARHGRPRVRGRAPPRRPQACRHDRPPRCRSLPGTLAGQLLALGAAGGDDPDPPGIVHRLDRETSGLLVVARSGGGDLRAPGGDPGTEGRTAVSRARPWPAALAQRAGRRPARPRPPRSDPEVARHGRAARGGDVVRDRESGRACVPRGELETGRTHQIRVHLAAIELPAPGPVYGVKGDLGSNGSSCTRIASVSCTP